MKPSTFTPSRAVPGGLLAFCSIFLIVLMAWGCGKKEPTSGQALISGTDSKTWVTDQELRADGSKKYEKNNQQQKFQFFADGKFIKTTSAGIENGTWTYDPTRRSIDLKYGGDQPLRLQVLFLKDKRMRLQVPDGSIMRLKVSEDGIQ